ncbi:Na+-dependent transporter [Croceicoccus marinus]|jgi:BASS family bile acid:Na+ symporter|uniref:Na+-dependent transporter n=1 Tax=Croceicoccus marinus TaxID=450378 RepID=A0A7G6VR15_9SPHN|nr:Na+-dependent transporter [Croceicoccus marinus]QNE04180.1 Na+-dependent transporter [Croceicoccus marinus]
MTLALALKLTIMISVVLMLFALSLRARLADLGYLLTHWRLGLGAFAAMFVVVPAAAIAISFFFDLDPAVKIALVAIALSPIPPILPNKQIKAGGRACYITGLLFTATIASIFVAPFGLYLASRLFDFDAQIGFMAIAMPLMVTILLPMVLGIAAAPLLNGHRLERLSSLASRLGGALMLVAAVGLLIMIFPRMLEVIGHGALLALAVLVVAGLAAGYALGGPDSGDRAALALATSTRHPGVALAIAANVFPDNQLAPAAILLSLLLAMVVCIPFMRMITKQGSAAAA